MRWFWSGDGLVHEVHQGRSEEHPKLFVRNSYCNMVHGPKPVVTDAFTTCLVCITYKPTGRTWLETWHHRNRRSPNISSKVVP